MAAVGHAQKGAPMSFTSGKPFCEGGITFDDSTPEGQHHRKLHADVDRLQKEMKALKSENEDLEDKSKQLADQAYRLKKQIEEANQ